MSKAENDALSASWHRPIVVDNAHPMGDKQMDLFLSLLAPEKPKKKARTGKEPVKNFPMRKRGRRR